MKKALLTEAWRAIWKTRSRFLSILGIIAIGTGFFAGIKVCTPDMMLTTEEYFREYNLSDIHLVSTFGFNEDDLQEISQHSGVKTMMPSYSAELFADVEGDGDTIVKAYSVPLNKDFYDETWMNRPVLKEGRLPEKKGECLVEQTENTPAEYVLGATVHFRADDDAELSDMLDSSEYTIVGIVESPYYLDTDRGRSTIGDGVIDTFVMVPEEHFCYADDIYTDVHLLMKKPEGLSPFDEEYEQLMKDYREELEALADVRTVARYDEIMDEANAELDDAKEELAEGIETQQRELADAREKIADAEKEIANGEREYWEGLETFNKEIADAEQELLDAEEEIKKAEKQISKGKEKLEDGWDQYLDGLVQYEAGLAQFEAEKAAAEEQFAAAEAQAEELRGLIAQAESGLATIAEKETQLEWALMFGMMSEEEGKAAQEQLAAAREEAENGIAQAQDGIDQIEAALTDGKAQLAAAEAELEAAAAELSSAESQLEAGEDELRAGEKELKEGKKELEEGWVTFYEEKAKAEQELADAQKKIADGKAELEQAKIDLAEGEAESNAEIADAQQKIADAEAELADVEIPEWYIWDREDFGGHASYRDDMMKVDAIAAVFPVFFILVAALVCLTTMSRMVEEERTQIGTMKALGYSRYSIMAKYLIYSISASLLGSAIGLTIGFQLFPQIIIGVYRSMYTIPDPMTPFRWDYAIACTIAAVFCTAAAAFASCHKELESVPAQLMRPKAPKAGKRVLLERIPWLWQRMSFTHKVTLRNVFRYKRRAFMSIVGVAGCTALMVAGFGIRYAISETVVRQYGDIFRYDGIVAMDDVTKEEKQNVYDGILNHELIKDAMPAQQSNAYAVGASGEFELYLLVPENAEELSSYITLKERKTQEPLTLAENSVIINEKLAEVMNLDVGDSITLRNEELQGTAIVGGLTENYTMSYVYMLPQTYQAIFGEEANYNTVLFTMTDNTGESRLSRDLMEEDAVLALSYSSTGNKKVNDMVESLDIVVWVLIAAAGLLAFIVLYNLANININERVRELATIKVLGFYDKEVSAYIYRENNISTALGILAGMVMGAVLEHFAVIIVEADNVMFARDLPWTIFVYAAILTIFFASVINLVIHFKLKKINMVESMKSVE